LKLSDDETEEDLLDPRQLSSVILRARQSSGRSAGSNRRFEFHKRGQQFICSHNQMFSVIAMRVCNPDRSPARTHG
jgi:hypothetical protein